MVNKRTRDELSAEVLDALTANEDAEARALAKAEKKANSRPVAAPIREAQE